MCEEGGFLVQQINDNEEYANLVQRSKEGVGRILSFDKH